MVINQSINQSNLYSAKQCEHILGLSLTLPQTP